MTILFKALRGFSTFTAALLMGTLSSNCIAAASAHAFAYSTLEPNILYQCLSNGSGGRKLLEASISGNTISYVVSDVTAGVVSCNRNGTIYFPTPALPPGTYNIQVRDRRGEAVSGSRDESVIVDAAPPTTAVFTLFHPPSNTFFATASAGDRDQLRALGWQVADSGFTVWPASGPAPRDAKAVCRFFYAARSTHFYTASESDCASLKALAGFTYEGVAFYALVPKGGRCGPGTKAVYRLFDPVRVNHRYTDNADTVTSTLVSYAAQDNDSFAPPDTIIPSTWRDDGIAFCSPVQ